MISLNQIQMKVEDLKRKYIESDPKRLCECLDILVLYIDCDKSFKGMYTYIDRIPSITVNSNLCGQEQCVIIAHELGHRILHTKEMSLAGYHSSGQFDYSGVFEREANLFAAELLLDDTMVCEMIQCGQSTCDIAKTLNVPSEIVHFKLEMLRDKGKILKNISVDTDSRFLGRI